MAGCATCPDPVKAVLRRRVAGDLARVRAVKYATTALNRALTELANKISDDLVALIAMVGNIPEPVIDLSELIAWLTCPLLPIALLEDPSLKNDLFHVLDPEIQKQKLKSMLKAYVEDLSRIYDEALRRLNSYDLIRLAKKYLDELRRIDLDAESFARSLIITATIAGLGVVDPGCAVEYNAGPYAAFALETSTFVFTDLYPSGFDPQVAAVMDQLAEAERKLSGWRLLIITGI